MDWLPPLIGCDGDWQETVERLYARFQVDLLNVQLTLNGQLVKTRSGPATDGKDMCFWHLITEGDSSDSRIPNFKRCARIGWIRPIIERAGSAHSDLPQWEQRRNSKTNLVIALPDFSYLVFLGKRGIVASPYFVLLSAYPVEETYRCRKYESECNNFWK